MNPFLMVILSVISLCVSPVWASDPVFPPEVPGGEQASVHGAMVMVVNRMNPVQNLSVSQLGEIFSRKIRYWHIIGGNRELAIRPVIGSEQTLEIFRERILKKGTFLKYEVLAGDAEVLDEVAGDETAIGLVVLSEALHAKGIRILAIDGQEAAPDNLKYPLLLP